MLLSLLRAGVIVSFAYALIALVVLVARTVALGKRAYFAEPQGEAVRGVVYAFGRGMMPWEKESAGNHLLTFVAGLVYHAAIFLAVLYLAVLVAGISLPPVIIPGLRVLLFAGVGCGLGLLYKRLLLRQMRLISSLDDYLANVIVNAFIAMTCAATVSEEARPLFFVAAIVLFTYVPMGKIRHCFFFFYTRVVLGVLFGRRGIFPHPPARA
jgi:hypothetical protein